MPLFEFALRPLESVTPWDRPDQPDDLHLAWFGLSDGCYSLNCGTARLFQYTKQMLEHMDPPHPGGARIGDWVDYPIVRLHEDVLDLLPCVLEEVPAPLHDLMASPDLYANWRTSLSWAINIKDDVPIHEAFYTATNWLGYRKLDCGYLIDGPNIWIWKHRNRIFLLWDNLGCITDGISRWTAAIGLISMSVDEWLLEIKSLHHRLMASMQERIHEVVVKRLFPRVKIDYQGLLAEQKYREKSLSQALAVESPVTDWRAILQALDALKKA